MRKNGLLHFTHTLLPHHNVLRPSNTVVASAEALNVDHHGVVEGRCFCAEDPDVVDAVSVAVDADHVATHGL